jgi:MFS family permease
VLARGWRVAWAAIGAALMLGLAPVAWLLVPREPESNIELEVPIGGPHGSLATDATLAAALRSPAFWVFGVASSLYGLVASGIGLFNESILAERGFSPDIYHTALAVTAITGLAGNFVAGAWADRGSLRRVLVAALILLTGALVALPHVTTAAHVMAQAVAMGVAGGFVMVVFFSFWGKAYGRTHLGRIQGVAQALTVFASAIGPLLLAWCAETTGSYAAAFYALAATLVLLALAALVVRVPAAAEARMSAAA